MLRIVHLLAANSHQEFSAVSSDQLLKITPNQLRVIQSHTRSKLRRLRCWFVCSKRRRFHFWVNQHNMIISLSWRREVTVASLRTTLSGNERPSHDSNHLALALCG